MLSRTAIVGNSTILRRQLPHIYRRFFDMLVQQAKLPALPFAVSRAQENENAELIAQLEWHRKNGTPITMDSFIERLIDALKAKS